MGGAKKKGITQMERSQKTRGEQPKGGKAAPAEKKPAAGKAVKADEESVLKEVTKMKASTPSAVAVQLGIKVSYAKDLLEELARKGVVKLVSSTSRLRIYKAVSSV